MLATQNQKHQKQSIKIIALIEQEKKITVMQ